LKEDLNKEIKRRATFKWWDPLATPKVGQDRSSPLSLPDIGKRMLVTDETYTINNSSEGSIECTRNIHYPAHGENPSGEIPNTPLNNKEGQLKTSAARLDADEIKNYLVGLSKIMDINLFYGRDEVPGTAFRDPIGIENALKAAQNSKLNAPLHQSDIEPARIDPSKEDLTVVTYHIDGGIYVMPSGEYDGEELLKKMGPDETNFFDDHGAKVYDTGKKTPDGQPILVSDSNYKPMNPFVSPLVNRNWNDQQNSREDLPTKREEGGVPSTRFGPNPRNPQQGNQYRPRPVFGGVLGACNSSCTGLCFKTCDNECSENCTTTCWSRCGNACTSSCGNVCTGCNSMCYTSCKTKCENSTGYSCLNVGAKTVNIVPVGSAHGSSGAPGSATWPKNTISYTTYKCNGCAYTCQFYPNKRTTCWDAGCQELCFTSCRTACSTTCFGGCIDNAAQDTGKYGTGKGRGCSSGCTVNCVGACQGVCIGECVHTCFHACKALCYDNCSWKCHTSCGSGCANGCKNGCTGCHSTCAGSCIGENNASICIGCGKSGGCTSTCQHDCNKNCIGWGCRSICGTESAGSCESNCRLSCMSSSCTSMCGNACASQCTTCVNNCGAQCGCCSSMCSTGCEAACNITCTEECQNACTTYCYMSCTESCGSCFKAGTLIETELGLVPIEEVKVGDMVLTQSGKYHRVYKNFVREANDIISIRAVGTPIIHTTEEHPFWVKKYIGLGKKEGKLQQLYSDPEWVEARDLKSRDKLSLYTPPIGNIEVDPGIAYMVGRWLGDGWRSDEKSHNGQYYPRFSICCGKHEIDDFELKLYQSNIEYTKSTKETSDNYRIPSMITRDRYWCNNDELISILKECGKYSYGKKISKEIYNWNINSLMHLLQGYSDADGHFDEDHSSIVISTVSKELALGVSTIMRMIGRNPSCHVKEYPTGKMYIEGREVNVRTVYTLKMFTGEYTRNYSEYDYDNNTTWSSVRLVNIPDDSYTVYNLSVEDNPTFYADGVLVHNCSDMCYSCVGMCIGICSVKCENGCSSCDTNCGWWCDSTCNRQCFNNCSDRCISTCSGSCSTYLEANTTTPLSGPEKPPTSEGYQTPNPSDREEERESFKLISSDVKPKPPVTPPGEKDYLVHVFADKDNNFQVVSPYDVIKWMIHSTVCIGGVWSIYEDTGEVFAVSAALSATLVQMYPNIDGGRGIILITLFDNPEFPINPFKDIYVELPRNLEYKIIPNVEGDIIILIQRESFGPFETVIDEYGKMRFIQGIRE